ncbi:MAG TPA: SpoIIE family protein phosphatase [Tepidisphaeraceae bacterium]|nr:SpoIIE family protein phosphatase [Tepidisphaeraceae bacterium]
MADESPTRSIGNFPALARSPNRPVSIRLLMAVVVVLPVAAVSTVLVILSSRTSTAIAEDLATTLSATATDRVRDDLATFLGHAIEISDRYALRVRDGRLPAGGDLSAWTGPMFDDLVTTPSVASICFGNPAGDAVWLLRGQNAPLELGFSDQAKVNGAREFPVDPETGNVGTTPIRVYRYDPRERPWYAAAVHHDGPVWTPIYFWFGETGADRTTGTGYTRAVRGTSGQMLGVLVIDVTLEQLSETLRRLPIAERGFAFIVDERGLLVAASRGPVNSPSGARLKLEESSSPFARGVADAVPYLSDGASTTAPLHRFDADGAPARATVRALSPYPGIHWRVIVGAPESAFLGDAQALQRRQVLLASAAAMVSALLALGLGRQVTRPLLRLRDHVRRVGSGDLSARLDLRATRELRELSQELNRMSAGLSERIELERSLELAKEVQQSLLPADVPAVRGFEIAARCRYCDITGGDYYDFIETSPAASVRDDNGRVVVALGDALGHGISSALLMATARAALRAEAQGAGEISLGEVMTRVNQVLCHGARDGRFMTMLLMSVDSDSRAVRWARAGHEPFILYHPVTDTFPRLSGGGLPLGIEMNVEYEEHHDDGLESGTLIVAATDGLFDAQNPSGEAFGRERVRQLLRGLATSGAAVTARSTVDALDAALTQFMAGARAKDDVTFVVIRVLLPATSIRTA